MKRSAINSAYKQAKNYFEANGWTILPSFQWDITDFGLGDFERFGLVLINLANEPEYCEKLMYARREMKTPYHYHKKKKEDIICRKGTLALRLASAGETPGNKPISLKLNNQWKDFDSDTILYLQSGERITITQGIWHEFWPVSDECIIGEVSTANDDENDNFFLDSNIGRYPEIEEDEPSLIVLVSEK